MQLRSLSKLSRKITAKAYVFLIFFILLPLLVAIFMFNGFFSISQIEIESSTSREKLIGIEAFKGTNLLLLSRKNLKKILFSQNPWIKSIEVGKKYPNTLLLSLQWVEPLVFLKLNNSFATLSNDGKVLYKVKVKDKDLPVLNFYQQLAYSQIKPGDNLNYKEIVTALFFQQKMHDLGIKIDSLDISSLSMIVFNVKDPANAGQVKIIFTSEKDSKKQTDEFEAVFKQFKIEAKDFKVLDLRFDKPVVKF